MSVFDWSTTSGSNGNSDSNINFSEGQAPSTVNDSARALMARVAHWLNMLGANVTMGGASNAYTFTSGESLAAYAAGMRFLWSPNADSTGAVTLNVDTIGAKKVYMPDGTQAGSGDLDADSYYDVVYDTALDSSSGGFKIVGFPDTTLTSGDYLAVANDLSDLNSASDARTNLGLGSAATQATSAFLQPSNNLNDVGSASAARSNLGLGTMALAATSDYAALSGAQFTGNVGIGVAATAKLHVREDVSGNNDAAIVQNRNASGESSLVFVSGALDYSDDRLSRISGGNSGTYIAFDLSNGAAPTEVMRIVPAGLQVTGDVDAVDFNASSDQRLKENFRPFDQGLEYVLATEIVRFNRIGQEGEHIGPLAQQMEVRFPEGVNTGSDPDGLKTVDLLNMLGASYAAIQELHDEIQELRNDLTG